MDDETYGEIMALAMNQSLNVSSMVRVLIRKAYSEFVATDRNMQQFVGYK
jgi:hypothetical protein